MENPKGGDKEDDGDDDVFFANEGKQQQNGNSVGNTRTIDRYGFIRSPDIPQPVLQEIMPRDVYAKREKKWLEMFKDWDYWMSKRYDKVKRRCRKGIPHSVRGKAWQLLSRSHKLLADNKNKYKAHLEKPITTKEDTEIKNDLHRSLPTHQLFADNSGQGQTQLYNVLRAYAAYNPIDGFCQAQAPVVAVLLLHMTEEEAFWCLVSMIDNYVKGYYSKELHEIKQDGQILMSLLKYVHPKLHKKMKELNVDGPLFMVEWFMCIFSRDLPWPSTLRIWDIFFCEGVKILFKVALVLLKFCTEHLKKIPDDFYDLVGCLKIKNMPPEILQPGFLLEQCFKLPITNKDMEREHRRILDQKGKEKQKA